MCFRTLFKRETGSTIIGYITKVRMERAQELLADRNLKTSEIAERVGYQDAHYFNYCYRKYYGISASEARKKGQNRSIKPECGNRSAE